MTGGITVAYSGVHQAYQLALAAEEIAALDYFYCSIFAGPGRWGGKLVWLLGERALHNRRIDGLSLRKVKENPWPLLNHSVSQILRLAKQTDWEQVNIKFDSWLASKLTTSLSRVFVGTETCCAQSLEVARKMGMLSIVDWPGISTPLLNELALKSAQQFTLATEVSADTPEMHLRKQQEMELADIILTCSNFQAQTLHNQGFPSDKLKIVPLWVDPTYWYPISRGTRQIEANRPLRVMYAGKINLRKGIPYLIEAVANFDVGFELTLVGKIDKELLPFLRKYRGSITLLPACTKAFLRNLYQEHDVFVLPSLGDSFGFVAIEAMACGLPVIVTENCGVPVPDPSWRVPVMDSNAIAQRLKHYAENREVLGRDGLIAQQFAQQFTPERYRAHIKTLFRQLLRLPA